MQVDPHYGFTAVFGPHLVRREPWLLGDWVLPKVSVAFPTASGAEDPGPLLQLLVPSVDQDSSSVARTGQPPPTSIQTLFIYGSQAYIRPIAPKFSLRPPLHHVNIVLYKYIYILYIIYIYITYIYTLYSSKI